MTTLTPTRRSSSRNEARAQQVLLRHRTLRAALTHLAHRESFDLSTPLLDLAIELLNEQPQPSSASETLHQMKRALYESETRIHS